MEFDQAWQNRVIGMIDDVIPVYFISREDLIANKLQSAHPQDLADVDHLRRAANAHSLK